MSDLRTVVMMGFPGAGKGTQSDLLAQKTGFRIFSQGQTFRDLAASNTELGERVANVIDKGSLMPHWFSAYLFQDVILNTPNDEGLIFEGAGRTLGEAEMFDEVSEWLGRDYRVVFLNVPEEEVVKRIEDRSAGRKDDTVDAHVRIQKFQESTAKALDFFRAKNKVIDVNGNQSPEVVHEEIITKLQL